MAWRRLGGKSLSKPMIFRLLTHIGVTRPQLMRPKILVTRSHEFTNYSKYSRNKWKTSKSWFLVHLWAMFYYHNDVIWPQLRLKSPARQCWLSSLFRIVTKKVSKHYWSLVRGSTGDRRIPSQRASNTASLPLSRCLYVMWPPTAPWLPQATILIYSRL